MSEAKVKVGPAGGLMRHETHLRDVAEASAKDAGSRTNEEAKLLEAERVAEEARERSAERRCRPELYRITPEQAREIDMRAAAEREATVSSSPGAWLVADAVAVVSRAWDEYRNTVNSRMAMGGSMTAAVRAIEMRSLDPVGLTGAIGAAVFGDGPTASLDSAMSDDATLQAVQRGSESASREDRSFAVGMVAPCGVPAREGASPRFSIDMQKLDGEINPMPEPPAPKPGLWARLRAAARMVLGS